MKLETCKLECLAILALMAILAAAGCSNENPAPEDALDADGAGDVQDEGRADGDVPPDDGGADDGGVDDGAAADGDAEAIPGVWNLLPTSTGFEWISPTGDRLCKYAGVSTVDSSQVLRADQFPDIMPAKYPDWTAWAAAQQERLAGWGFNAAGMYSYAYQHNLLSSDLPVAPVLQTSSHAVRDDYPYHIKNLNHYPDTLVCSESWYLPPSGGQIDVFDPGLEAAYRSEVAAFPEDYYPYNTGNVIFIITEEGDDLFGINKQNHTDFGYVVAAQSPRMDASIGGYAYSDHTVYSKLALRDYLADRYGCPGSADPASGSYCGAAAADAALAALNAAWSTGYTTWNTSDTGDLAGIAGGTYGSHGTGTGLLDENGANLLSPTSVCSHMSFLDPWARTTAIAEDLHGFVAYFAEVYAQKLTAAWAQPALQPRPPVIFPLYNAPGFVYTAMAPYVEGFWVSTENSPADVQRIIAAAPGEPLIVGDYSSANPDSPFSANACDFDPGSCFDSQEARGAGMVSFWRSTLHLQDSTGRYVVVGLEHWGFYDQANEGSNLGLVTADHDNPYDGSATTANGEPGDYGDALTAIADYLSGGLCDP